MYHDDVIWYANQVMTPKVVRHARFQKRVQKIKWAAKSVGKKKKKMIQSYKIYLPCDS